MYNPNSLVSYLIYIVQLFILTFYTGLSYVVSQYIHNKYLLYSYPTF